mmetsp:Transcript_33231/g.86168  ORF Transcript_33231/g.86168 Transcript_33231/m.86168 type:complete len:81 (+) Transcript_33231:63-305(+)
MAKHLMNPHVLAVLLPCQELCHIAVIAGFSIKCFRRNCITCYTVVPGNIVAFSCQAMRLLRFPCKIIATPTWRHNMMVLQ